MSPCTIFSHDHGNNFNRSASISQLEDSRGSVAEGGEWRGGYLVVPCRKRRPCRSLTLVRVDERAIFSEFPGAGSHAPKQVNVECKRF